MEDIRSWDITRRLMGEEEDNPLSAAIKYDLLYKGKEGEGALEDIIGASRNEEDFYRNRDRYFKKRTEAGLDVLSMASDQLARGAFTSFDKEVDNLLKSGGNALKSLMGYMNPGEEQVGIPAKDYKDLVGRNIYNTLFKLKGGTGVYEGLDGSSSLSNSRDRFIRYKSRIDNLHKLGEEKDSIGEVDSAYSLANRRERTNQLYRGGKEYFSKYSGAVDKRLAGKSSTDISLERTRRELAEYMGRDKYSREVSISLLHQLIDGGGYMNKPGIGPIAALFESAERSISIDLFQLQNDAISDVIYDKVMNKADEILDGRFTLDLKLAYTSEDSDITGHSILGPNMLTLERFRVLREEIAKRGVARGMSEEQAQIAAKGGLNIVVADEKNHPKTLITERFAVLGSLNLTSPVGRSAHQEGSTYEAIRFFHLDESFDGYRLDKEDEVNQYYIDRSFELASKYKSGGVLTEEGNQRLLRDIAERVSSAKLYKQTSLMSTRVGIDPTKKLLETGLTNIGGASDIYKHMESTLDYLVGVKGERASKTGLVVALDQVYALSYIDEVREKVYRGEMGEFKDGGGDYSHRQKRFDRVQDKLYRLAEQGRLQAVVDVRNYRETILEPTYKRVEALLGSSFSEGYGSSLERLVGEGTFKEREARLRSRGIDNTSLIKQLLIVTSGAISLSTQSKQHLKTYTAYEAGEGGSYKALSSYMGSSNLGPYSLGMDDFDDRSNAEFGVLFGIEELKARYRKGRGEYELDEYEEGMELEKAMNNTLAQFSALTGRRLGEKKVGSMAMWEHRVDRAGIDQMIARVDQINKDLGFGKGQGITYEYTYGGRSGSERTGIRLNLDMNRLTGLNGGFDGTSGPSGSMSFHFTVLKGAGGSPGMVYALDQGKVISSMRFVNKSDQSVRMPFGGVLGAGSATTVGAIEHATLVMASMAGEMINRSLVWAPEYYMRTNMGADSVGLAFAEYLEVLATGKRQGGEWLRRAKSADIHKLQESISSKFLMESKGSALSNLRQMTGVSTDRNDQTRLIMDHVLSNLEEMKRGGATQEQFLLGMADTFNRLEMSDRRDIALEIVSSRGDLGYQSFVMDGLKEFKKSIMEGFITRGQASTYSSSQAMYRQLIYGVGSGSQYQEMVEKINHSEAADTGMGRLFKYMALTVPLTYGPTSDLYTPGAIRGVAEGGGSRAGVGEVGGYTAFGLTKQSAGDYMDVDFLNYTGIGHIMHRQDYVRYIAKLLGKDGDLITLENDPSIRQVLYGSGGVWGSEEKKIDTLATFTFNNKKRSQIPQRLKNVIGSRPLASMSVWAQEILESELPGRGAQLNSELERRLGDLREEVKKVIRDRPSGSSMAVMSETAIEEMAERIVSDEYKISLMHDLGVRSVLGNDAALIVEDVRREVIEELGLVEEELNRDDATSSLVGRLATGRLVAMDLMSGGAKGFTGARSDMNPIILVQLTGLYTDTFYANPLFGSTLNKDGSVRTRGMREGFLERQKRTLKSSTLRADWTDKTGGKPIAVAGDIVAFDKERQKVIVISGATQKSTLVVEASKVDIEDLERAIDDGIGNETVGLLDTRTVFHDIVDNQKGTNGGSVLSKQTMGAWHRIGEDSIEYLLDMQQLSGSPESNELRYEMVLSRSKKAGTGARMEGIMSLFKGVAVFTHEAMFRRQIDQLAEMDEKTKREAGPRSIWQQEQVDINQVFGLFNPSNLKSYSYQHGSYIMRNRSKREYLLGSSDKHLATALLMSFGTDFLTKKSTESRGDITRKVRAVERSLFMASVEGHMGGWYQALATSMVLMETDEKKIRSRAREYLEIEEGRGSISDRDIDVLLGDSIKREQFLQEVQGRTLMSKSSFSAVQTPMLMALETDDILQALNSREGESSLSTKLGGLLNKDYNSDYMVYTDMEQRSAAMIFTALDVMGQIASQGGGIDIDRDANLRDNSTLMKIAAIARYDITRLKEDEEYREEVTRELEETISRAPVIRMRADANFSQSKEPIGSKYEANLEYQYIIKPILTNARAFSEQGKVSQLQKVVASIMAVSSNAISASQFLYDNEFETAGIFDIADISNRRASVKATFLGAYGSTAESSDYQDLRTQYKKQATRLDKLIENKQKRVKALLVQRDAEERGGSLTPTKRSEYQLAIAEHMKDITSLLLSEGDLITEDLRALGRRQELDSNKEFGTGQAKTILGAMESAGQKSIALYLPSISGVTQTVDGRYKVSFDYSKKIHTYIPSAQELKQLGLEFGTFLGPEVQAAFTLSKAFAPGTSMSKIVDQMARNRLMGREEVLIAQEELSDIKEYWNTARDMNVLLADATTTGRMRKAAMGENRLSGGVSTMAPSFLVPDGVVAMAEETMRRHGLNLNPKRLRALNSNNHFLKTNEHRDMQDGLKAAKADRALYRVQKEALSMGWSAEASSFMSKVRDQSSHLHKQMAEIEKLRIEGAEEGVIRERIIEMQDLANSIYLNSKKQKFKGEGDRLAGRLGRDEGLYWRNRINLQIGSIIGDDNYSFNEMGGIEKKDIEKVIRTSSMAVRVLENRNYVVDGLAIGSSSSLAKDNVRVTIEDFEGSIRSGKTGSKLWDQKGWDELTRGASEVVKKQVMEDKLHSMLADLRYAQSLMAEKRVGMHPIQKGILEKSRGANESFDSDIRKLIKGVGGVLGDLKKGTKNGITIDTDSVAGRIEGLATIYDTTFMSMGTVLRHAPPGGTEQHRQGMDLLSGMVMINEYAAAIETPDKKYIRYDRERGRTGSFSNPLGIMTLNGGDYDGDPYSTVFHGLMDMQKNMERSRDRVFIGRATIKEKSAEIRELTEKRNRLITRAQSTKAEGEYKSDRRVSSTRRGYESHVSMVYTNYEVEIEKLNQEIAAKEDSINQHRKSIEEAEELISKQKLKMKMLKEDMSTGETGSAIRKEVANYLGINKAFFMDGPDGYLTQAIDTSVLPTLLEKGSGLYGGIEGEARAIRGVNNLLDSIFLEGVSSNEKGEELVRVRTTREAIKERLQNLTAKDGPDKTTYQAMLLMDGAQESILRELVESMSIHTPDKERELTKEEYGQVLARTSSSFFNQNRGMFKAQQVLAQGSGVSMELSSFDMLTKILGKAGGDILGKTYNTIIGTLYADSPLLALGHIVMSNDTVSSAIKSQMNEAEEGSGDLLMREMKQSMDYAEGLQGFLKNIHQLLRDSIKLKEDDDNFLTSMKAKAEAYESAGSEEEKNRLINDMASGIGPGPGMKALTQLNDLISNREQLKNAGTDSKRVDEILSGTFGISTNTDRPGEVIDHSQYERLVSELADMSGRERSSIQASEVVNYKVAEDIRTLVAGFRWESSSSNENITGSVILPGYMGKIRKSRGLYGEEHNSAITAIAEQDSRLLIGDPRKRRAIASILGLKDEKLLDDKWNSMGLQDRLLMMQILEEGEDKTSQFMGRDGAGLDRFSEFSAANRAMSSIVGGSAISGAEARFQEADIVMSMMNLATSGKLTGEAQVIFYQSMIRSIDPGIEPPSKSDPDYKQKLSDYNSKLKEMVLRRMMVSSRAEGGHYNTIANEALSSAIDKLFNVENLEIAFIDEEGEETRARYDTGFDFIQSEMQHTGAGRRASTMVDFMKSMSHRRGGIKSKGNVVHGYMELVSSMLSNPNDMDDIQQVMALGVKAGVTPDVYLVDHDKHIAQYEENIRVESKFMEAAEAKSRRASNVIDVLAPLALSMLGGAIQEGGISSDMLREVAGATFMATAYMRPSFASRAGMAFGGSGFKLAMAMNNNPNQGEALAQYAAGEVGFAVGSMIAAPAIEGMVDGAMLDHLIGKKVNRGDTPLARKLRSGGYLDMDKYSAAKSVTSSISGALLSALMGSMVGGAAQSLVANKISPPAASLIDYALEGARNSVNRAEAHRVEMESSADMSVSDEMGAEDVEHTRETDPIEYILANSIDQIGETDYSWDTPGYVMVGVSDNSENY
jgi:hypothetical protein